MLVLVQKHLTVCASYYILQSILAVAFPVRMVEHATEGLTVSSVDVSMDFQDTPVNSEV